jgi:hypothetical protein
MQYLYQTKTDQEVAAAAEDKMMQWRRSSAWLADAGRGRRRATVRNADARWTWSARTILAARQSNPSGMTTWSRGADLQAHRPGAESGDLGADEHVEDGEETDRNGAVVCMLGQPGSGTRPRRAEMDTNGDVAVACMEKRKPTVRSCARSRTWMENMGKTGTAWRSPLGR